METLAVAKCMGMAPSVIDLSLHLDIWQYYVITDQHIVGLFHSSFKEV